MHVLQAGEQVHALQQEKAELCGALEAAEADRDTLEQRLSQMQAATPRCPLLNLTLSHPAHT